MTNQNKSYLLCFIEQNARTVKGWWGGGRSERTGPKNRGNLPEDLPKEYHSEIRIDLSTNAN